MSVSGVKLTDSLKFLQRGGESPDGVVTAGPHHQSCLWFLDVGHRGREERVEGDRAMLGWGELENLQ